jgi:drug/metabolite transporter (DMT)-like permease
VTDLGAPPAEQPAQQPETPQPAGRAPSWLAVAVALGIVYVVWGSTYLGIRIVVEEAPALTAMGQRFFAAGLVLATVLAVRHGPRRLAVTGRQLLGCAFLGLCLPLLGNGMVAVAEQHGATSGVTALLIAVAPLAIVVFRLVERDVPRPWTLVGVVTGFAGLTLLVLLSRTGDTGSPLGPSLLVLFAGSCWAFGSYLQPRLALPRDPFVVAVYEMLIGGAMLVGTGLVAGQELTLDYGARTWVALSYLVVFGSVVAFSAYVWLLANAPISLVATYAYVNPVVAVLLGSLILDEVVTGPMVLGGAIVVGAVAVVVASERGARPR